MAVLLADAHAGEQVILGFFLFAIGIMALIAYGMKLADDRHAREHPSAPAAISTEPDRLASKQQEVDSLRQQLNVAEAEVIAMLNEGQKE